jgi:hypothetical protein
MSDDSEVDAQMSPKEVAEAQKCEANLFRIDWVQRKL